MKITSLEVMESIVKTNDSLSWDGWDVVELKKSSTAWMKPEGAYANNSWHIKSVFPVTQDGWSIPNKYTR
jgi:hypothetical protein